MRAQIMARWLDLLQRMYVPVSITEQEKLHHLLAHYYMPPRRYYHTLDHIHRCLFELDGARRVENFVQRPDELELAIWFHNAIYETWANNNEKQSAGLAYFFATELMGLTPLVGNGIHDLILATTHRHRPSTLVGDARVIVDIDLSGLGGTAEQFDRDDENIRQEYYWVDWNVFRIKRADILEGFLESKHIYLTDYFRDKYEVRARENLARAIKKLRG